MNTVHLHDVRPERYALDRNGARFHRALMAEWCKFRTVRTTGVMVGVALASAIAIGILTTMTSVQRWDDMPASERATFDPVSSSLVGVVLSTLVLGALAARSMTVEHSSGMIATTFVSVPARRHVFAAKAIVVSVAAFAVALAANLASFVVGQAVFAREDVGVGIGDPGAGRAIVFGAVAVGLLAIVAVALGAIFRRSAPANIVLSLTVLGGQLLGLVLPESARRLLPSAALEATVAVVERDDLIEPALALAMLAGYATLGALAAVRLLVRSDVR